MFHHPALKRFTPTILDKPGSGLERLVVGAPVNQTLADVDFHPIYETAEEAAEIAEKFYRRLVQAQEVRSFVIGAGSRVLRHASLDIEIFEPVVEVCTQACITSPSLSSFGRVLVNREGEPSYALFRGANLIGTRFAADQLWYLGSKGFPSFQPIVRYQRAMDLSR